MSITRALFAPGFAAAAGNLVEDLAAHGIAVTGLEPATGPDGIVAAADHLRETSRAPALLIGHDGGGPAVLTAAVRIPEVVAVATIGAPADFGDLAALRRALLILHAPTDEVVSIDNAGEIFTAARHPKRFVSLDDADHSLSSPRDARYAADVIAAWVRRYLPEQSHSSSGEVVVAETGAGGLQQTIAVGAHRFLADEPVDAGGRDTGPSPYDLLLTALGACTSMTLRLYAGRKNLPLQQVRVALRHAKIHAQDRIERTITLTGDLDDVQRARLLEIADKCPVHRTLTSEIDIRTQLEP